MIIIISLFLMTLSVAILGYLIAGEAIDGLAGKDDCTIILESFFGIIIGIIGVLLMHYNL